MADKEKYGGPERRKFTRISFSFPVRFKQYDFDKGGVEKEGITQYAYSNDISLEGIKLKFLENVEVGKYLKLKLTLPVEQGCIVIHAKGEVKWNQYDENDKIYIVGVQFLEMDEDDKIKLEEFIRISQMVVPPVQPSKQGQKNEKIIDYLTPEKIVKHFNRPIRVLVVDDEKNVRYILNLKLAMKKMFIVEQAGDGDQAFQKINLTKPDIILLDIMLPGIDGFQICRKLKESPDTQDIPVIFVTARDQVKDVIRGIRVGVDDYITKPYEFEDLFYQMIKVLDSAKTTKRVIAD